MREDAGEAEDEDEEVPEVEETPVGEEEEIREVTTEISRDLPASTAEVKVTKLPTARVPRNPEERDEMRGMEMEKGETERPLQ